MGEAVKAYLLTAVAVAITVSIFTLLGFDNPLLLTTFAMAFKAEADRFKREDRPAATPKGGAKP